MKKLILTSSVILFLPAALFANAPQNETGAEQTQEEVIEIELPVPPTPPKPVILKVNGKSSSGSEMAPNESIKFSKRTPPKHALEHNTNNDSKSGSSLVGDVNSGQISAYLRGKYTDPKTVESKLKAAGFEVVASVPLDKAGTLTSIIFTHPVLKEMASKLKRGFAASMRVLVDSKDKQISITNPLYMAKGFLQKDFDETKAKKVLASLNSQFEGLKNSEDATKFQSLPNYQFMKGMPKYENMVEVAEGKDLPARAKANGKLLFEQKLDNGSVLIGVKLSDETQKFPTRIGTNNAALLPYPVLLENGKAYILDPRYYISVMYPKLKMSEFMGIAAVPDAIIKDCKDAFKAK